MQDVAVGDIAKIKNAGYIHCTELGIASTVVGNKIGYTANGWEVVMSGEYVGVCKIPNFIKLVS